MEAAPTSETQAENIKKLEQLRSYLADGFLLHGGKKLVTVLEPRQATDTNPERVTGKAFAIYAEAHDVRIPILMALFDKKDPSLPGWSSSYHGHGPDSVITIGGTNCTFSEGYVYVLPPDSFHEEGTSDDTEYISPVPVTPVAVIKVDASMLQILENIENQIID